MESSSRQHSQVFNCHKCSTRVSSVVSTQVTLYSYIASFFCVLILQWWSILILPMLIPLSKAIVHRCSSCNNTLATYHPFGLPSMHDEVMTLKCGDCAVILSRTYTIILLILTLCGITYMSYSIEPFKPSKFYIDEMSNATWSEYISDCGSDQVLKNSFRVSQVFKDKYKGKEITWDGYLFKIIEIDPRHRWHNAHPFLILTKMIPTESEVHADLIISLDNHEKGHYQEVIDSLTLGDHFRFNATLESHGDENKLHHLHGVYLEKLEGRLEISPNAHNTNIRYNIAN